MARGWIIPVVILVMLAGCSGYLADGRNSEQRVTVTPAPVPSTEAPGNLPAGLTREGVEDPWAISKAHHTALRNSFTLSANQTVQNSNGSLRAQRNVTVRVAANHSRHHVHISFAGPGALRLLGEPPARAEFWSDGELYLSAITRENTTAHKTFQPTFTASGHVAGSTSYWLTVAAPGGQPALDIYPLFAGFTNWTVGRIEGINRPMVRVTASQLDREEILSQSEYVDTITDGRFVAVIDSSGFVRRYHLTYTGRVGDDTVTVTRRVSVRAVGSTTVQKPEWYSLARNGSVEATPTPNDGDPPES